MHKGSYGETEEAEDTENEEKRGERCEKEGLNSLRLTKCSSPCCRTGHSNAVTVFICLSL